jgi:CRP-like cAMP-binding protein
MLRDTASLVPEALRRGLENGWLGAESPDFRDAILDRARLARLTAGALVFAFDDEADTLVGVAEGHVAFSTPLASGEEHLAHVAQPGIWVGAAMIASPQRRRLVTATARTDVTVALVSLPLLRGWLAREPQHWPGFARLLTLEWHLTACITQDLLLRSHRHRIAATLLRLAGLRPQAVSAEPSLVIPVTHREIAAMSNCSESLTHVELRRLRECGWLDLSYASIRLLRPDDMLQSLANPQA